MSYVRLLKLQCKSAGTVWPELLYTVQSDIERILAFLQGKTVLGDDACPVERKCGGKEIIMTLLPDTKYVLYPGVFASDRKERCIVEDEDRLYSADPQLFLLLEEIIDGKG